MLIVGQTQSQPATNRDELLWGAERPLVWDDFRGPVDQSTAPDNVASTAASLGWSYALRVERDEERCIYLISAVETQAVFDRARSWVRPGHATAPVLTHEQGHFDIAQIFKLEFDARAEHLLESPLGCSGDSSDAAVADADAKAKDALDRLADSVWQDYLAVQELYDERTDHGLDSAQQERWSANIAAALQGAPWRVPEDEND
jgi:hypothetical protein